MCNHSHSVVNIITSYFLLHPEALKCEDIPSVELRMSALHFPKYTVEFQLLSRVMASPNPCCFFLAVVPGWTLSVSACLFMTQCRVLGFTSGSSACRLREKPIVMLWPGTPEMTTLCEK